MPHILWTFMDIYGHFLTKKTGNREPVAPRSRFALVHGYAYAKAEMLTMLE